MTAPLGPSLEMQNAVTEALRADSDLKTLVGNPIRLFSIVPANPTFPYLTIGDDQNVPDLAQFLDGSEIFFDVHVWARGPSSPSQMSKCKQIGATLVAALPEALSLTENRNLLVERRNERYFMDPDTVTAHGVVTFRALVEPA